MTTEKKQHGRSMKRDAINIAINVFRAGISNYSDHDQELLTWLWGYTFEELGGSQALLTKQLGHDYTTIHQAFTGYLNGDDLATFIVDIQALQKRVTKSIDLVDTVVTQRIREALDYARDMCAMVSIQGPTGRSKTYTAQHWAHENNHGRAKYIRVPSGCSRRTLVQLLAKKSGIRTTGQKTANLEWRLTQAYNHRNVLIIDEAGHLLPRTGSGTSAIEFLRDLHDMCGCGIALIFTDVYLEEMKHGRMASYFEQFIGRIKFELIIPTDVLRAEVRAVVESFTASPSLKLQQFAYSVAQNRDGKLRTLFEDLQRAKDWAQAHQRDSISFNDLLKAVEWRKSGGIWSED